jgi:phosphoribosyl-AMP cyclohydrolase
VVWCGRRKLLYDGFLSPAVVCVQQSLQERRSDLPGVADVTEPALTTHEREEGAVFAPKFDAAGLLTAVVVDASDNAVLVVAHMNAEALAKTLETGKVHFWSRSRGALWMKGETSGHVLAVESVLADCDQDALLIRAQPAGPTCHTGARSCFYRAVVMEEGHPLLRRIET